MSAKRALVAADIRCDHDLLLDRHKAATQQLRRDWPSKVIEGDGWYGLEEYRQALNDAPPPPGDKRDRLFGVAATRTHLGRLTQADLIQHDPDNGRWRERPNPYRPLVNPEVSARHNARNRGRYRAQIEAERIYAESVECLYGPICGSSGDDSHLETTPLMPCSASESNSPEGYNYTAPPNQSGGQIFAKIPQPTASDADLVRAECLESLAAVRGAALDPDTSAEPNLEHRRALEAQYRLLGDRLAGFDEADADWVAEWIAAHAAHADEHCVMAKWHRRWRITRAKVPEASVRKSPKSLHAVADLLPNLQSFNTAPPAPKAKAARLGPLRAQSKTELIAARAQVLAECQSARPSRAYSRRLADIDELLAALEAPPATAADLHTFCEDHPWAGTLSIPSAVAVRVSIELWAYIARRIETKVEPVPPTNPPAALLWRAREWRAAQLSTKGCARYV